jgi:hypothetical protein
VSIFCPRFHLCFFLNVSMLRVDWWWLVPSLVCGVGSGVAWSLSTGLWSQIPLYHSQALCVTWAHCLNFWSLSSLSEGTSPHLKVLWRLSLYVQRILSRAYSIVAEIQILLLLLSTKPSIRILVCWVRRVPRVWTDICNQPLPGTKLPVPLQPSCTVVCTDDS